MKTFSRISHALCHAQKTGETAIAIFDLEFCLAENGLRPAGTFSVCTPDGNFVVNGFSEVCNMTSCGSRG